METSPKNPNLRLSSYDFHLPESLVAQRPADPRDSSRLLVYRISKDEVIHSHFYDLHHHLPEGCPLILNNSKVFPCRLVGKKETGGEAEIFFLSPRPEKQTGWAQALIKCSGKKKIGDRYIVDQTVLELAKVEEGVFWLKGPDEEIDRLIKRSGTTPIPPYIRKGRGDERDEGDYQTLYGKVEGSVAAPTAGLHFTPKVFDNLASRHITPHFLTLHVGLGTFAPIKTENIEEHSMHQERFFIPKATRSLIDKKWGKLYCVGTTCLRVLESLGGKNPLPLGDARGEAGETDLFIHPEKKISSIEGLITNFHLPKSSLFILICALIGRKKALELYETAKASGYRFFSYGDAMLVLR
ncbi:MAG: tRNA preQ1(34) S-adenosylmethionine ribosyltransferase-isomerase QueA [Bacteriovoracales bacterium]|nr:tRNA preQ1(34) S-adenosylmethionine ribosyltransferase-isomerase QueA [Bacteriovoracales bacterium]